jgi:hypothetical protein
VFLSGYITHTKRTAHAHNALRSPIVRRTVPRHSLCVTYFRLCYQFYSHCGCCLLNFFAFCSTHLFCKEGGRSIYLRALTWVDLRGRRWTGTATRCTHHCVTVACLQGSTDPQIWLWPDASHTYCTTHTSLGIHIWSSLENHVYVVSPAATCLCDHTTHRDHVLVKQLITLTTELPAIMVLLCALK